MMKYLKESLLLASTMVFLAPSVQATDEFQPSPNVESFHQLDVLRSQNAVLAESVKNKELRNKLNESEAKSSPNPGPQGSAVQSPVSTPSAQVLMVSGMGNNLTALISLPNGGQVAVKTGNTIPGVGLVKFISLNEVTVSRNQQIINLPFASDSSQGFMPGGVR